MAASEATASCDVEDMHTASNGDEAPVLGLERRYADDGQAYTWQQFVEYFGEGEGQRLWETAAKQRKATDESQSKDTMEISAGKVADYDDDAVTLGRRKSEMLRLEQMEQDMMDNLVSVSSEMYVSEATRRSQLGMHSPFDADEAADAPDQGGDTQEQALSVLKRAAGSGSLENALQQKSSKRTSFAESESTRAEARRGAEVNPSPDDSPRAAASAYLRVTGNYEAELARLEAEMAEEEGKSASRTTSEVDQSGLEQDAGIRSTRRWGTSPAKWAPTSQGVDASQEEEEEEEAEQPVQDLHDDGLHVLKRSKEKDLDQLTHRMGERVEKAAEVEDEQDDKAVNGDLDEGAGNEERDASKAAVAGEQAEIGDEGEIEEKDTEQAVGKRVTIEDIAESKTDKQPERPKLKRKGSLPIKKEDYRICAEIVIKRLEPLPMEDQQRYRAKQLALAEEEKYREENLVMEVFSGDRSKQDAGDSFKVFRKWWRGKSEEVRTAAAVKRFDAPMRKEIFALLVDIRSRALYKAQANEMLRNLIAIKEWIADKVVNVREVERLLNEREDETEDEEGDENVEDSAAQDVIPKSQVEQEIEATEASSEKKESSEEKPSPVPKKANAGLEKKLRETEAAEEGKRKIAQWCKENGYVDAYTRKKTFRGDSKFALHTAVKQENVEIIKLLLQNGANKDCTNSKGQTPLQLAQISKPGPQRDEIIKLLRPDLKKATKSFGPR